jgi:hypothetical protein
VLWVKPRPGRDCSSNEAFLLCPPVLALSTKWPWRSGRDTELELQIGERRYKMTDEQRSMQTPLETEFVPERRPLALGEIRGRAESLRATVCLMASS